MNFGSGVLYNTIKADVIFDRLLLTFDLLSDVQYAYPHGWLSTIARFSADLHLSGGAMLKESTTMKVSRRSYFGCGENRPSQSLSGIGSNDTFIDRAGKDFYIKSLPVAKQEIFRSELANLKKKILAASYTHKGPNLGKLFKFIDKNGDGRVDDGEMGAYLKKLVPGTTDQLVAFLMASADTMGVGSIDSADFKRFINDREGFISHKDGDKDRFIERVTRVFNDESIHLNSTSPLHGKSSSSSSSVHQRKLSSPKSPQQRVTKEMVGIGHIAMIACGTEHSVLVDDSCNVYSFGCGDHGELGHGKQGDAVLVYPREIFGFKKEIERYEVPCASRPLTL